MRCEATKFAVAATNHSALASDEMRSVEVRSDYFFGVLYVQSPDRLHGIFITVLAECTFHGLKLRTHYTSYIYGPRSRTLIDHTPVLTAREYG